MQHLYKTYITVWEYCKRKNVYPSAVYLAIKTQRVEAIEVGEKKLKMIDWDKYKGLKVKKPSTKDPIGFENWFAKHQKRRLYAK